MAPRDSLLGKVRDVPDSENPCGNPRPNCDRSNGALDDGVWRCAWCGRTIAENLLSQKDRKDVMAPFSGALKAGV